MGAETTVATGATACYDPAGWKPHRTDLREHPFDELLVLKNTGKAPEEENSTFCQKPYLSFCSSLNLHIYRTCTSRSMTRLDLQQKWTTWMFRMVLQDSTVMEELESLMQWFVSDYLNLKLFDKRGQTSTEKQVCSLMRDWRHSWEIWIFWIEPYKVVLGGLGNCQAFFWYTHYHPILYATFSI